MELNLRPLRAEEVDCRVNIVRKNGVRILLYKDARCDQNILDECVGPMNWQRHHSRDNANCIVSIWDDEKQQWIEKEDTGTESYTEKEKGLASDSFKRACFNWGIGRELYSAPFIWFSDKEANIVDEKKCYDHFECTGLEVTNGKITFLTILDKDTKTVKSYGKPRATDGEQSKAEESEVNPNLLTKSQRERLEKMIINAGALLEDFTDKPFEELTKEDGNMIAMRIKDGK